MQTIIVDLQKCHAIHVVFFNSVDQLSIYINIDRIFVMYAKTFATCICWFSIFVMISGGNMFVIFTTTFIIAKISFSFNALKTKHTSLETIFFFVNKYQWKQHTVTSNPVVNYPITLGYWLIVHVQLFFSSQISHMWYPY